MDSVVNAGESYLSHELIGIGPVAWLAWRGGAVRREGRGCRAHESRLEHRADRARHDAVRARVFRVHWRIDKGQPRRITLRRVIPVIITVADGGDRAPEIIGIFSIEDRP